MRIPGRKWFRTRVRPVTSRLFPGAIIMGYHRVADLKWDPLSLAVGTNEFREQIEVLATKREIVGLRELVRRASSGDSVDSCASITFDDGYRDFFENALPILEATGTPATVFVATDFIGRDFWWEQIAALLVPGPGTVAPLHIDDSSGYVRTFDNLSNPDSAGRAIREICHELRAGDATRISEVLGRIFRWIKKSDEYCFSGKPLIQEQISILRSAELIEIGAHSVTHGCLGGMSPDKQEVEIQQSRDTLQAIIGRPVCTFSYPNGSYSTVTPELVRQSGFECACTSREGLYRTNSNPFLMPRVWVPNVGGAVFEKWLMPWSSGGR